MDIKYIYMQLQKMIFVNHDILVVGCVLSTFVFNVPPTAMVIWRRAMA